MVYLRSGIELIEKFSLLLIAARRDDKRDEVLRAKTLLNHLIHHHRIALHRCLKLCVAIDIRAVGLNEIRPHQHDDK